MAEYDHILGLEEQIKRIPKKFPTLKIDDEIKTLEDSAFNKLRKQQEVS